MTRPAWRSYLRAAFTLGVVVGLVAYVWARRGDLQAALRITPLDLALLAGLIVLTWVLSSLPMLVFARLLRFRIGFWENLAALIASNLANYLPLRAGTVIKMRFFKHVHGMDYTAFVGVTGLKLVVLVAFTGVAGVAGILLTSLGRGPVPWAVVMLCAAMAVAGVMLLVVPLPRAVASSGAFGRALARLAAVHAVLRSRPAAFWALTLLTLAQFVVLAARLAVSFRIVGVEVPIGALLLVGPFTTLISFVNLTPGNLGVREWVIGGLSELTDVGFQTGVFSGTLDRSLLMAMTFLVGPVCLFVVMRRTARATSAATTGHRIG